jgi:carboxylesterase type B
MSVLQFFLINAVLILASNIIYVSATTRLSKTTLQLPPTTKTTAGTVIGKRSVQDNGVSVASYLGIYYGESTGGSNRFLPPKPRSPWTIPFNATKFSPGCVQIGHNADVPTEQSEDCLTLNVFTPAFEENIIKEKNNDVLLPVAVFFHGGAFKEGCSKGPFGLYSSEFFAAHGNVVVVTAQYRLGALGWLSTTGINGNMGLLDQRLVLNWVQKNILAFGGNKNSVTIWGESAGAMSSLAHMYSPLSTGLFHRAIQESNPVGFVYRNPKEASTFGKAFAKSLGCDDDTLACMQQKNISDIKKAMEKADSALDCIEVILKGGQPLDVFLAWVPTVGTPDLPYSPMQKGSKVYTDVPLLIGTNTNEGATFIGASLKNKLDIWEFDLVLDILFGTKFAKQVKQRYPVEGKDARVAFGDILTDYWFRCASQKLALNGLESPAYQYRYNHMASFAKGLWPKYGLPFCVGEVCHGAELPFVFHNTGINTSWAFTDVEDKMSRAIVAWWSNFIHTSNPNNGTSGLPLFWPEIINTTRTNIVINDTINVESTDGLCQFWASKD